MASFTSMDTTNASELASAPGDFSVVDNEGDDQQLLTYGKVRYLIFQTIIHKTKF